MVAHDEEHDGLLDEFELQDEDQKTRAKSSHLRVRRCARFTRRRIWCLISVIAITSLCIFGAVFTSRAAQKATEPERGHLGIRLHPQEHASRPPTTLTFNWTITAGLRSPDGVEKQVYLVNDEFPGPTIEARSGDQLVLHIHNGLETEGVSLHWHGLRMKNHNLMDGAVGITQCSIPPSHDYVYNFTLGDDEHGTFWWHSHSEVQRADGLWGGLIVHSPKDVNPPTEDYLVMVGDWFHRNQTQVLAWYADASSRGNEPVPDSLLVNGKGRFNCSMAVPARPVVCSQVAANELEPLLSQSRDRPVRLRFVNTGSVAGFSLGISGAMMQPVRVDGGFSVQAEKNETIGIIYPGERVDIDVKWAEDYARDRWLAIDLDPENFGYPNPALNPNQRFPVLERGSDKTPIKSHHPATETRTLDLQSLTAATQVSEIPPKAKETLVFYAKMEKLSHLDYEPVGFINHTSWKPQHLPLLAQNRSTWNENQLVPFIGLASDKPTRVDIVINNLDDGAHPFHIHGHSFYVLSSYRDEGRGGWGSYNPYSSEQPLNGLNVDFPLRKDTVSVPRRGHVVLALVADNPGIWMLHCHMLVHMARGMAMAFHVGNVEDAGHVSSTESRAGELCKEIT